MGNVQVRLPDELESALDRLADEMHTTRSEIARSAIAEGLRLIRVDRALSAYTAGEVSLERAAADAGVSIHRLASQAAERGIPYYRYGADEADADLGVARKLLRRDRRRS